MIIQYLVARGLALAEIAFPSVWARTSSYAKSMYLAR
jgi:hypothetical protein